MELLPTVHEGATVRAMEKKGIRTEKGEFNRWIKATNAVIRDIKKKITLLFDWIAEAKAELAKPQAPDLVSLLNAYYYKAFPWLAISNMDEQKLTVCEELMKIQIAFFEELGMQKIADHCVRIMEDYRKGIGKRKESDCR